MASRRRDPPHLKLLADGCRLLTEDTGCKEWYAFMARLDRYARRNPHKLLGYDEFYELAMQVCGCEKLRRLVYVQALIRPELVRRFNQPASVRR